MDDHKKFINEYLKSVYGNDIAINDFEDKNYTFDSLLSDRNLYVSIEKKERFFTDQTFQFLKKYDVLIELIQTLGDLQLDYKNFKNGFDINEHINVYKVNTSIGWFYKCCADRLVFFRYLNNLIYDVIDIDFRLFKAWFLNNLKSFNLQYSNKTTKTINAVVLLRDIPKLFYSYKQYYPIKNEKLA